MIYSIEGKTVNKENAWMVFEKLQNETVFGRTEIMTIHLPLEELARITVDLIVRANEGVAIPSKTILPVLLIKRGTT